MSEPANKADIQRVTDAVESLAGTIQAATEQQTAVLRDFVDLIERHREPAQQGGTSGGSATITVSTGGIGLWVAVTCCIVMLASVLPMALGLYWVAMDSRDRGHQMNALYMSVPGLRDLVDRQIEQNKAAERPEESQK
jgi:hypothetical protein